jgi:hypothetical protein
MRCGGGHSEETRNNGYGERIARAEATNDLLLRLVLSGK